MLPFCSLGPQQYCIRRLEGAGLIMTVTYHHIIAWTLLTKSTIRKIYLLNLWKVRLYFLGRGKEAVGGRKKKRKRKIKVAICCETS